MSEATTPKDQDPQEHEQTLKQSAAELPSTPPLAPSKPAGRGNGLALLALLEIVFGIALGVLQLLLEQEKRMTGKKNVVE